jgi:hypothetical protein
MVEFFIFVIKFFFTRPRMVGTFLFAFTLWFNWIVIKLGLESSNPPDVVSCLLTILCMYTFSTMVILLKTGKLPEPEPDPLILPEEHGVTTLTKILQSEAGAKHRNRD